MTVEESGEAAPRKGSVAPVLGRVIAVKPDEVEALGWAWLYLFSLMMSYYIMRPLRDQMGIAEGVDKLPWLFLGTLVAMIAINVPFGMLVRSLPRVTFISVTYRFFALNILLFAVAIWLADPKQTVWIGYAFFIWLSVFNLFVVSVFWAMIVDTFNSEQGKRLFASIAAAATVGGLVGSSVVVALAKHVPTTALLVAAAALLEVAVFGVRRLSAHSDKQRNKTSEDVAEQRVGGSIWAGFWKTFSSAYLFNTAMFLLLFSLTSTLLYLQQAGAVSHAFADKAAQKQFFATVELLTQGATLLIQLFLTGRITRLFGLTLTLALLPALSIVGFGVLTAVPTLATVVAFQVFRRAGNFAVARPTREVLYTVVPREDRYKAKTFIDTVIYRSGDQIGVWLPSLFKELGVSHVVVGVVAVGLSILWLIDSLCLGRRQQQLAETQDLSERAAAE